MNSLRSLWKSFWHFSVMWPKHVVLPFLMSTTVSNRTYAQTPAGTPRAEHGGSHGHLQTFGSIKWECDHFNGRPKARCYPFNIDAPKYIRKPGEVRWAFGFAGNRLLFRELNLLRKARAIVYKVLSGDAAVVHCQHRLMRWTLATRDLQ